MVNEACQHKKSKVTSRVLFCFFFFQFQLDGPLRVFDKFILFSTLKRTHFIYFRLRLSQTAQTIFRFNCTHCAVWWHVYLLFFLFSNNSTYTTLFLYKSSCVYCHLQLSNTKHERCSVQRLNSFKKYFLKRHF